MGFHQIRRYNQIVPAQKTQTYTAQKNNTTNYTITFSRQTFSNTFLNYLYAKNLTEIFFCKKQPFHVCSMLIEQLLTPYLSQLLLYQNISKNFMKVVIAIKQKYVRIRTDNESKFFRKKFFFILTRVLVRSVSAHCEKYCRSAKGYRNSAQIQSINCNFTEKVIHQKVKNEKRT